MFDPKWTWSDSWSNVTWCTGRKRELKTKCQFRVYCWKSFQPSDEYLAKYSSEILSLLYRLNAREESTPISHHPLYTHLNTARVGSLRFWQRYHNLSSRWYMRLFPSNRQMTEKENFLPILYTFVLSYYLIYVDGGQKI